MKLHILLISILFTSLAATAQVTPQSAFTSAPNSVYPLLEQSARLDLIDYATSGIDKTIVNHLSDSCRITVCNDFELTIETEGGLSYSFFPLQRKSETIIMLITTVDTPDADSTVKFYTHNWKQIPTNDILQLPSMKDWTKKIDKQQRKMLDEQLPFLTVEAKYDPATTSLTFTPTPGDYIDADNLDNVKSLLLSQITYKWNGKKFTR